jgi:hypothetical protein
MKPESTTGLFTNNPHHQFEFEKDEEGNIAQIVFVEAGQKYELK